MILPEIVALEGDDRRATVRLHVPGDTGIFDGHFPSMPVLPGVLQIDWVMRLAARCFGLPQAVADDFQVKFSRIIAPGMVLVLTLERDTARRRLLFEYRVDGQIMSSGRVTLADAP